MEAGHEDDAPRALEADAAVLGGLASGAGRRAVAEVADDGARTPSQQALDGKGNEQKATPGLFELKAPRERALALRESQQRSPNGAIVAASPARAAGEDENFAPGERHGSYAYGSLYFEETRLRSRYMLCRGEPGACPPEEVMANLCDEFGLPNPQMIFFGLGANGRWNTGFATLDVFASKLINQVRSSGPFRSELCGNQNFTARSCLIVASTSTPSTRCLLDGVAMPAPHRSTEPARPRHHREMTY